MLKSVGEMKRDVSLRMLQADLAKCERAASIFDAEGDVDSALSLRTEARRLRGEIGKMTGRVGSVLTTKADVLARAKPVNDGIESLSNDMVRTMTTKSFAELWADGCQYGWEDAFVRGYNGDTKGVKLDPDFAYDAGYAFAFSKSKAYEIGKAHKAAGLSNSPYELSDAEKILRDSDAALCKDAFTAWSKTHPEPTPNEDQRLLWKDFDLFHTRWRTFYLDLNGLGTFDSSDDAIRALQEKYDQYIGFVNRYKKLGFSPTYVPNRPADPTSNVPSAGSLLPSASTLLKLGALGVGGYLLYRFLTRPKPLTTESIVPRVPRNALPSVLDDVKISQGDLLAGRVRALPP
jgi:hypothetical protein